MQCDREPEDDPVPKYKEIGIQAAPSTCDVQTQIIDNNHLKGKYIYFISFNHYYGEIIIINI